MSFFNEIFDLQQIDNLIRARATGSPCGFHILFIFASNVYQMGFISHKIPPVFMIREH